MTGAQHGGTTMSYLTWKNPSKEEEIHFLLRKNLRERSLGTDPSGGGGRARDRTFGRACRYCSPLLGAGYSRRRSIFRRMAEWKVADGRPCWRESAVSYHPPCSLHAISPSLSSNLKRRKTENSFSTHDRSWTMTEWITQFLVNEEKARHHIQNKIRAITFPVTALSLMR